MKLRYRELVGRNAVLPLVGRRLPIVADESVRSDFGTGALKITPGHDPLDWEIGERHGIRVSNVFHAGDGNLHPNLSFNGRNPAERQKVEEDAAYLCEYEQRS